MGAAMAARARLQINLAVSQVIDIKQVATFPDIVFPIMWFEEVSFMYRLCCCIISKLMCSRQSIILTIMYSNCILFYVNYLNMLNI